ncbi:MAG TPA: AAA family ATPase, partial [Candidatus Limnocylindrales bacterium]|nr:AAA family ATPase [Candidatus Limnocylindrales bacterium]
MISSIRLQHFRSYSDEAFEFTPAVNIIVGPNASGKTNLLESLLVMARGSSYRVKDTELIAYDQPWARLDAYCGDTQRTVKIVQSPTVSKTYEIGGKTLRRLSLQHVLPTVVFEPNHLAMFSGAPDLRRSYLDDLLEQLEPAYGRLRKDYRRILTQRNTLLKRMGMAAEPQLFPWNVRLSEIAGRLVRSRMQ